MAAQPPLQRTPRGEFVVSEPITDLGFELGLTGTRPKLRLETTSGPVIWAETNRDQIERFVRQWVKAARSLAISSPYFP